jgi:PAS domain S-box-containing protein
MYHVLYVDDEQNLLGVTKAFLEKKSEFAVTTAASALEGLDHLKTGSFDAIVSDYQMPGMDGIAFLKEVRSMYGNIPFILFTGKGREEVVIQALNEGADFYLQKGGDPKSQFVELAHKIRMAFGKRDAENNLRLIEERYRDVVEVQTELICRFLPDGTHIFVNAAYCRYFGLDCREIIGKRFSANVHPDDLEKFRKHFAFFTPGHPVADIEHRVILPGGDIRWLHWSDRAIFDNQGSLTEFQSVGRDITDRKIDEETLRESEAYYRTIFENTGAASVIVEEDTTISLANAEFASLSGYPREEIEGKKRWTEFVVKEDLERMVAQHQIRRKDRKKAKRHYEFRFVRKNGDVRDIFLSIDVIPDTKKSIASLLDITERKQAETELRAANEQLTTTEEELRQQYGDLAAAEADARTKGEQLKSFMQNLPIGIFRTTPGASGKRIMANPILAEMHGFDSVGEFMECPVAELYADPSERKRISDRLIREGIISGVELHLRKKNGELFWASLSAIAVPGPGGEIEYFDGVIEDITWRKRAEEALRESEKRFRELTDLLPQPVYETDTSGRITFANRFAFKAFGYTPEELKAGLYVHQMIHPDDRDRALQNIRKIFAGEKVSDNSYRALRKDGTTFPVIIYGDRIIRADQVVGLRGIIADITEQKTVEEALRESEEEYRLLAENSPAMIYVVDNNGYIRYVNSVAARYLKTRPDTIIGKNLQDIFPAHLAQQHIDVIRQVIDSKTLVHREIQEEFPTGTLWIDVRLAPITDHTGRVVAVLGLSNDITKHKQAEEALTARTNLLTALINSSFEYIIFSLDCKYRYTSFNEKHKEEMRRVWKADIRMGMNILDCMTDPVLKRTAKESIDRALRGEEFTEIQHQPDPDIWYEFNWNPIREKNGDITGVTVFIRDTTEHKRVEKALLESEERFRLLFNSSSDAKLVHRLTTYKQPGQIVEVNEMMCRRYGYSRDELLQMRPQDIDTPEILPVAIHDVLHRLVAEGHATWEGVHVTRDGHKFPVEITNTVFEYGGEQMVLATARDITGRKRAEDTLRQANRQLNLLTSITRHDILNKASAIAGYLSLMKEMSKDPAMVEYCEAVESIIHAISSQIRFTCVYQDLGTHEPQWQELDKILPWSYIPETIRLTKNLDGVEVYADPMLEKVFFNLLDNSVKHGGRVTEIRASYCQSGDGLTVVWEDNGTGISADEKEQIFERGFGRNTGLGLFLVREILTLTGITIRETGEPGKGARFEIFVPKGSYRLTSTE